MCCYSNFVWAKIWPSKQWRVAIGHIFSCSSNTHLWHEVYKIRRHLGDPYTIITVTLHMWWGIIRGEGFRVWIGVTKPSTNVTQIMHLEQMYTLTPPNLFCHTKNCLCNKLSLVIDATLTTWLPGVELLISFPSLSFSRFFIASIAPLFPPLFRNFFPTSSAERSSTFPGNVRQKASFVGFNPTVWSTSCPLATVRECNNYLIIDSARTCMEYYYMYMYIPISIRLISSEIFPLPAT